MGSNLKEQQKRDKLKLKLCKNRNIPLIVIPYIINKNDFQQFIINKCKKFNINIPNVNIINIKNIKVEYINNRYNLQYKINKLEEIKNYVVQKKGVLLSNKYINNKTKLEIKCEHNHIFEAVSYAIKKGVWCTQCHLNNIKKNTFNKYKKSIEKYGHTCVTKLDEYKDSSGKIKWICKNGHNRKSNPRIFKKKSNHCCECSIDKDFK